MACGIGLLPEDRRLQGLMMRMSVLENATPRRAAAKSAAWASFTARQERPPSLRWRGSWR